MAEDWQVDVKVTDRTGQLVHAWSSAAGTAGTVEDRRSELDKLNMKEAMDQFRFFGTLRALISWFPIVITLSILGLVWSDLGASGRAEFWAVIGGLCAVFPVIFLAQLYLQKRQFRARLISELLQRRYLRQPGKSTVESDSYHQIALEVSRKLKKKEPLVTANDLPKNAWFDGASGWLAAFMLLVVVIAGYVSGLKVQTFGQESSVEVTCGVEEGDLLGDGKLNARCRITTERISSGNRGTGNGKKDEGN